MKKTGTLRWLKPTRNSLMLLTVTTAYISYGQVTDAERKTYSTPDKVQTARFGTLNFKDGAPDAATTQKLYDELDYIHAVNAFMEGYPLVNQLALRKGFIKNGINDNEVIVTPNLMSSKSLFLTANADTYYFWSYLDLTKGPLVVETPPGALGIFDDMTWKWMGDFGLPGPDRGEGGRYIILPPDYKGAVPEGGFFVYQSNTLQASFIGRCFLQNNDPKPVDEMVKKTLKIYPYVPGGLGSSIGNFLNGKGALGQISTPASPKFVDGTGKVMSTIPPADYAYFELLNEVIQTQPAGAIDAEIAGQCAAIGIVKGKPFNPDARMKKILTEAVTVANATARAVTFNARDAEGFNYYGGNSNWVNSLFTSGYEFMTPPPEVTKEGLKHYPSDGARKLNARTWFFYLATGVTPAMCMRLENVGSQYLAVYLDNKDVPLDGSKTYKVTLPPNIPAARFWSFTVYDNQSRSMLETPQLYPRAGSQTYPSPAAKANPDGSTTVYFGPTQPAGVDRGNWIQTTPGKGWCALLRLYSPLKSFFDKSWKAGEVELVK
ncbi:MAG TPA: DUF1254 domain-containing protein [Chryseolinea sp.]|nr:DUF1254 domain-containing protein [Chryseolinea sp.]